MKTKLWPLLAVFALVSCDQIEKPDDRICLTASANIEQGDWNACVHKWAYRLARSPDPAEVVAEAAVEACEDAIEWEITEGRIGKLGPAAKAALTQKLRDTAPKQALFRVVQARAGNCVVP